MAGFGWCGEAGVWQFEVMVLRSVVIFPVKKEANRDGKEGVGIAACRPIEHYE